MQKPCRPRAVGCARRRRSRNALGHGPVEIGVGDLGALDLTSLRIRLLRHDAKIGTGESTCLRIAESYRLLEDTMLGNE